MPVQPCADMFHAAMLVALTLGAGAPDAQENLGEDFWRWRAETQPAIPDDIPAGAAGGRWT